MDGTSFDRLAVAVDRLRQPGSRRAALRLLLGGSVAGAVAAIAAPAGEARHRCRSDWTGCTRDRQCCSDNCDGFICRPRGSGGGNGCRGDWFGCTRDRDCCSDNCSGNICRPRGSGGGNCNRCLSGFKCCGSRITDGCCSPGLFCCNSRFGSGCCPNGFRCTRDGCTLYSMSRSGEERVERTVPRTDRVESIDPGAADRRADR